MLCSEADTLLIPSQRFIARIARNNLWMKFWDITLDFGSKGTLASLTLLNILILADRKCPVDTAHMTFGLPPDTPLCSHLLSDHLDWSHASVTPSDLVDHVVLTAFDPEHFSTVLSLGYIKLCI